MRVWAVTHVLHECGESHGRQPFLVVHSQSERKKLKCEQGCRGEKASESGMHKAVVGKMVEGCPGWCVTRAALLLLTRRGAISVALDAHAGRSQRAPVPFS